MSQEQTSDKPILEEIQNKKELHHHRQDHNIQFQNFRIPWTIILIWFYLTLTWISIRQTALPSQTCHEATSHGGNCVSPLIVPGNTMLLELWLYVIQDEGNNETTENNNNDNNSSNKRRRKKHSLVRIKSCQVEFTIPMKASYLPIDITSGNNTSNCTFVLPTESRTRWSAKEDKGFGGPLKGMIRFRQVYDDDDDEEFQSENDNINISSSNISTSLMKTKLLGPVLHEIPLELTRTIKKSPSAFMSFRSSEPSSSTEGSSNRKYRKLLEGNINNDRNISIDNNKKNDNSRQEKLQSKKQIYRIEYVPYLKYHLQQPLLIRFVNEKRLYGSTNVRNNKHYYFRNDGLMLSLFNETTYRPMLYIDDNAMQYSSMKEIGRAPADGEEERPPINMKIQIGIISPMRDIIIRQHLTEALKMLETIFTGGSIGGSNDNTNEPSLELDEFRYWLKDERLYRFMLTQLISFVHVWLDYLAFKDEIKFYRNKKSFGGVSLSTVVFSVVRSTIIFLYLLDSDGNTSWIVLLSILGEILIQSWKVLKLLRSKLAKRSNSDDNQSDKDNRDGASSSTNNGNKETETTEVVGAATQKLELDTSKYDRVALLYLQILLYPIVIGYSIYALYNYKYKSFYSWVINCLVDIVYTFGFVSLCPQLYINYKLKSVAHLPWKVFIYKIFNTFVDDVFAFIVDMPLKHRLMTLRDDVVFLIFLYQAYVYRVDYQRTNEYGYAYDNNDEKDELKEKPENVPVEEECKRQQQKEEKEVSSVEEEHRIKDKDV